MAIINPKWIEYNLVMNEGGEGYNPHSKYIAAVGAAPVAAKQSASNGVRKMIAGKARTRDEAIKFARNCLSGTQKEAFLAQVAAAWPQSV